MGTSDVTSAPYSVFQAALEDIKRLVTIRPDLLQLQCSLSDIGKVIVDRVSILMSADIAASEEENLKDLACLIEMRSKIRESQRPSSSYWPIEVYLDDGGILDCAIKREIVALEASSTSGCAANCMDLVERYAKLVPHLYSYQQNLGSIIANKLKLLSTPACSDNFSDRYSTFESEGSVIMTPNTNEDIISVLGDKVADLEDMVSRHEDDLDLVRRDLKVLAGQVGRAGLPTRIPLVGERSPVNV